MAFVSLYFSLGSNLGDRRENILEALRRLDEALGSHWKALSRLIETKPMGFVGGKFLNGAVLYRIPEGPDPEQQARELLATVKRIEREMGRLDPPEYDGAGNRIYHSRIIDIDILFLGDQNLRSERLTLPHPQVASRPFVIQLLQKIG